jgi:hypothetical protein
MNYVIENLNGDYITVSLDNSYLLAGLSFLNIQYKKSDYFEYTDHLKRKITVTNNSVYVLGKLILDFLIINKLGMNSAIIEINKIYFDWVAKYSNNYSKHGVEVKMKNEEKPILKPAKEIREKQTEIQSKKNCSDIIVKISEAIENHIKINRVSFLEFSHQDFICKTLKNETINKLEKLGYTIETFPNMLTTICIHW